MKKFRELLVLATCSFLFGETSHNVKLDHHHGCCGWAGLPHLPGSPVSEVESPRMLLLPPVPITQGRVPIEAGVIRQKKRTHNRQARRKVCIIPSSFSTA